MRKLMLSTLAVLTVATAVYAQRTRELLITTEQPALQQPAPEPSDDRAATKATETTYAADTPVPASTRAGFIKAGDHLIKRDRIVSIDMDYSLRTSAMPFLRVWIDGRDQALELRGKAIEDLASALGMPELVPERE